MNRGSPPTSGDYNSHMNFSSYPPVQPIQINFSPQYQSPPPPQSPGPQVFN